MDNLRFVSVKDGLPTKECWCLMWISDPPSVRTRDKMVRTRIRKIFKVSPSLTAAKFAVNCIRTYANADGIGI